MDQHFMDALPNDSTLEIDANLRGTILDLNNFNDSSFNHTKYSDRNKTTTAVIVSTFTIVIFIAGLYYITTKSIP